MKKGRREKEEGGETLKTSKKSGRERDTEWEKGQMNKTGGQKAAGGDGKRGEEVKCQKAKSCGDEKEKIVVLVREDGSVDEYFKRQTKSNDTL